MAALTVAGFVLAFPSIAGSQAPIPGNRLGERLYVGEVEISPPSYRNAKAFHFTLLNTAGSFVDCGTGPGARPTWYYVERCGANDQPCSDSAEAMFELIMSAKVNRLPLSVHAPNCKVDVLHLW